MKYYSRHILALNKMQSVMGIVRILTGRIFTMAQTQYSAVIVTRNRPEALALSLPLLLTQSRPAQAIWVIDSSDDPTLNAACIARLNKGRTVAVQHRTTAPGLTVQRNIGLAEVETDVVFFPDDDSLVYPGALDAMMRIYDLDKDGRVGGVCSAEAKQAPEGALPQTGAAYQMTRSDQLKARISRRRFALERRLFPDPFHMAAARAYAAQGVAPNARTPDWLEAENAVLVPWMTGFRMSFRTALIRQRPFNENLGRYALFEDTDASFNILRDHLLVGARNAQIYHHKAPTQRANGFAMGAMQILNRAYVLACAGHTDRQMQAHFSRFSRYKLAQYALGARSPYGRDRLAGARAALRAAPQLFSASPEGLTSLYLTLRANCFESED